MLKICAYYFNMSIRRQQWLQSPAARLGGFQTYPQPSSWSIASPIRSKPHAQIRHQASPKTIHKKISVPQRVNNPYATKPSLLCGDEKSNFRLSNCAASPKKLR
jgi:hypothetical protein